MNEIQSDPTTHKRNSYVVKTFLILNKNHITIQIINCVYIFIHKNCLKKFPAEDMLRIETSCLPLVSKCTNAVLNFYSGFENGKL